LGDIEVVANKQDKSDYLALLRMTIEKKHGCDAIHRESIPVHEKFNDKTIWQGNVEVYELTGHPEAQKCYAWSHHEKGTNGSVLNSESMRLITVLGKRPVDSPQMAVRTAIFYDVQPVPVRDMFSR
jgi:hypothetical protein